jgi:hypothetical protein
MGFSSVDDQFKPWQQASQPAGPKLAGQGDDQRPGLFYYLEPYV